MHEHRMRLDWRRATPGFGYEEYNRAHSWAFDAGIEVRATAAPAFLGEADRVDPEEAFVASLSSCHMLTFLAIASRRRLVVDAYEDDAVGVLAANDSGQLVITDVTLQPRVVFAPGTKVDANTLAKLHERAHHDCFLANSVLSKITVVPRD